MELEALRDMEGSNEEVSDGKLVVAGAQSGRRLPLCLALSLFTLIWHAMDGSTRHRLSHSLHSGSYSGSTRVGYRYHTHSIGHHRDNCQN